MYLVRIDPVTRLVDEAPSNSGWRAIKNFSVLTLEEMTVVALHCDHFSPYQFYSSDDRFQKILEEIYGDRTKLKINSKKISEAISKYNELQYNPDLEFIRINREVRQTLLVQLREASEMNDHDKIKSLSRLITENKKTTSDFEKDFNMGEAINNSVTESGYELSRIELELVTRKNSKFVESKNSKNPKKLKL